MTYLDQERIIKIASSLRRELAIGSTKYVDLIKIIKNDLNLIKKGLKLEIFENHDESWQNTLAEADTFANTLRIRSDVYAGLKSNNPRDRFTIAHEIGHFCLGHDGIRKRSSTNPYPTPLRRQQETEADIFAANFLAPIELASKCNGTAEISQVFGLSAIASEKRLEEVKKEQRKRTGQKRPLPKGVIDFMLEAEKRGSFKFKSLKDKDRE